ncbi:MAG: DUF6232 family protein [Planctomycetes bacterium]|nr:DUF6232 family protein [Planctomycetota bacterium]
MTHGEQPLKPTRPPSVPVKRPGPPPSETKSHGLWAELEPESPPGGRDAPHPGKQDIVLAEIVETPQWTPNAPPRLAASGAGRPIETEFFSNGGVTVTNARFTVHSQTYVMHNITSVRSIQLDPSPAGPLILFFVGAFAGLILGCGGIAIGAFLLWIASAAGAACFYSQLKPTYSVLLMTSAREVRALECDNLELIADIVAALNESIMMQGAPLSPEAVAARRLARQETLKRRQEEATKVQESEAGEREGRNAAATNLLGSLRNGLESIGGAILSGCRRFDGVLKKMAGEENDVLYRFIQFLVYVGISIAAMIIVLAILRR